MKLELKDRIDSNNAVQVEKEMRDQLTGQNDVEVVLDATDLEYISSAGLRVILRLKKTYPDLRITNVSSEVYEILDMTGFTEMMTVEKAYRVVSVEGCEVIGESGKGETVGWTTDRLTTLAVTTRFDEGYAKHALQHGAGKTLAVRLDFADAYGAGLESLATTPSDAAKTIRGMGLAETAALTLRYTDRYGVVRSEPDPIKTAIDELRAAGAGSAERDTGAAQPVKLRDKEDARCFA